MSSSNSGIGFNFATRPDAIHLLEFLNQGEELGRRSNTKSSIVLQEVQPRFPYSIQELSHRGFSAGKAAICFPGRLLLFLSQSRLACEIAVALGKFLCSKAAGSTSERGLSGSPSYR
jgi:hypothetical protein